LLEESRSLKSQLPITSAAILVHSTVSYLARQSGIRVLSIKGPFAATYLLREPKVSADADILVDPQKFEEMCQVLSQRGWRTRVAREAPRFLDAHSTTLIHERWPCDIDLHHFFPGFFETPARVFEALWAGRRVHFTRQGEVAAPSPAGMAAILALHAARTPDCARSISDLASVSSALTLRFDDLGRRELLMIAEKGRAQWVLRDLMETAGFSPGVDDATSSEKAIWTNNQQPASYKSASLWLNQLRVAPLSRKSAALFHAVWVKRADIPRNDVTTIPTWGETLTFQRSRWVRGIVSLVRYLRRQR